MLPSKLRGNQGRMRSATEREALAGPIGASSLQQLLVQGSLLAEGLPELLLFRHSGKHSNVEVIGPIDPVAASDTVYLQVAMTT
jgi:hypothetical protein